MEFKRIVVLGGSGFLGRSVVARLAERGLPVCVPTRRRDNAKDLILLPTVEVVEASVGDAAVLRGLLAGAQGVINLIGILHQTARGDFDAVHTQFARTLGEVARDCGVARVVQVSALKADASAPSAYLRSKAAAEHALRQALTGSPVRLSILRPSVLFGPGDSFLNLFAKLAALTPVLPLACPGARFQPVYVGDVAHAVVACLEADRNLGGLLELGGPQVYTLAELVALVCRIQGLTRWVLPLGPGLSSLQAAVLERLPGRLLTRDNLASMRLDNICSGPFPASLGFTPQPLEGVAPGYLGPAPAQHRYDRFRAQARR